MKHMYPAQFKKALLIAFSAAIVLFSGINRTYAQATAYSESSTPTLLLSFTGEMNANGAQLVWTMENETNGKSFIIERSVDGGNFDSIGVVSALNDAHQAEYSYTDTHMQNGNNSYRLLLLDADNVARYSKVVMLNYTNTSASNKVSVFPNPAVAILNYTISSHGADQVTVQIFNLAGVLVSAQQQQLADGENQQWIAVNNLKSGNYFLKISNKQGTTQQVQEFVKL